MSEVARGCLYYLPGKPMLTRRRVDDAGLGYLLDGRGGPGPTVAAMSPGPDGLAGAVFTIASRRGHGAPETTLADKAKWSRIPGTEAWLGVVEDALPGPEDLQRSEIVDGHDVVLGDGFSWRVPVVRLLDGGSSLPRALEWDGLAWRHGDVRPAYRCLWAAALRMWDALAGSNDDGAPVTLTEEATTAATAIALNYRVGPAEISALGLLDTHSEVEVLKALIDLPALEALRGK